MSTQRDLDDLLQLAEGFLKAANTFELTRTKALVETRLASFADRLEEIRQESSLAANGVAEIESEIRTDLLPKLKPEHGVDKFLP